MPFSDALLKRLQKTGPVLEKALIQDVNTQYADRGLRLEVTGPWPPYSFCPALDMEPEA